MNLFNLAAVITLDGGQYEQGINKAEKKTSTLASSIKKIATGGLLLGVGKQSIQMGMDFEASMSQVAATMGMTKEEVANGSESFKMLEDAAKKAGATTQFSASESAEALNYLALAGYDAEKSVAMLPKVLNLAAAGGMDLATASDMVTDSMSALGLETKDADKFMDQMAKTSQKSNTSVSQLGNAILTVGGTAKVLKGGTAEMNAQLGILADNGIKGAEGGTALRNVILSLSSPTDNAAAELKKLGVEVFDAGGNMRATNEIFKDMDKALGKLSQKERTQALSNIFNKVDLKSANALLANSGKRFDELSGHIENSNGAAAAMAETMNDNLAGSIKTLKSAMEGLQIALYQKVDGGLKVVVKSITKLVSAITEIVDTSKTVGEAVDRMMNLVAKGTGRGLALIIANIPKFVAGGLELVNALIFGIAKNLPLIAWEFIKCIPLILVEFAKALPKLLWEGGKLVLGIIAGVKLLLPLLIEFAPQIINFFVKSMLNRAWLMLTIGAKLIPMLVQGIVNSLPKLAEKAIETVELFARTISERLPNLIEKGTTIITSIIEGISQSLPLLIETAITMINTLVRVVAENLPLILEAGGTILVAIVTGILEALPQLINSIVYGLQQFITIIVNNLPALIQKGKEIIDSLLTGIVNNLPKILSTMAKGMGNLLRTILQNLPKILAAGVELIVHLVKGLIKALPQVIKAGGQLMLDLLKELKDSLPSFADVGKFIVEGIWNGIKNTKDWLLGKISDFSDWVVDGVKGFFGINSPSRVFRDEIGKWIPPGIAVGIEDNMQPLEDTMKRELGGTIDLAKPNFETSGDSQGSRIEALLLKILEKDTTIELDGREVTRGLAPYQDEFKSYNKFMTV